VELLKKPLDPVIAMVIVGFLDIFLFLVVGAWTVGGGETMITGLIAHSVMGDKLFRIPFWVHVFKPTLYYWKMYISLGMGFGALVAAVLAKEFYWRIPRHLNEWLMITAGGFLMGVGIRLAFICNVSTFFAVTPQMNLGGYLAVSGIIPGAWVGSWIYKRVLES